jgi:protein SCO1/2
MIAVTVLAIALAQSALPPQLRDIGIDQKLDAQAPLDVELIDEEGHGAPLGDYLRGRPVVLAFVYYDCPMLCGMQLNGLLRAMRAMPIEAGKDYDVLTVSIDPRETPALAAAKKREYVAQYRRPGGERGWRFLTARQPAIDRLTAAAGYRYAFDEKTNQYVHAAGVIAMTPEGRFARYFYGIEYSARDLRWGLVEASRGKIGSPVDAILLYCFHYDPATGKYGLVIRNVIRASGVVTIACLLGFWFLMYRQRRKPVHDVARIPTVS